jgi:hypothetical protein
VLYETHGFSAGFAGIGFTGQLPGVITTGMNWLYAADEATGLPALASNSPV